MKIEKLHVEKGGRLKEYCGLGVFIEAPSELEVARVNLIELIDDCFSKNAGASAKPANQVGLKDRFVVFVTGRTSKAITLSCKLKVGKVATLAAGRLILIDPRGEISGDKLLELLERFVEPNLWKEIDVESK